MKTTDTPRGFGLVMHRKYPPGGFSRLIQESSAIGDYDNSYEEPGSSFLWVGEDHHLNRQEIAQLIAKMQHWLDTSHLPTTDE